MTIRPVPVVAKPDEELSPSGRCHEVALRSADDKQTSDLSECKIMLEK